MERASTFINTLANKEGKNILKDKTRLQKYIAECGVASRRKAEELISAGKVKVNGQVVTQLGTQIDPTLDKILVNNKVLKQPEPKIYIKLNKPRGYISSCRSFGEKTILDLVKDIPYRLYPIGRLDKESEGLLLLTNDGELANRLMHPRYEHEKEYVVNVELRITNDELRKLSEGVIIDGKKTLPAEVKRLGEKSFSIVLREGRNRQIRRMVEGIGNKVVSLKRVRINNIQLGKIPLGKYELLLPVEINYLV